jgi:hypothetical protein
MNNSPNSKFDLFASNFVRAYWETVKKNTFPMPPDEPIEETLDELLSVISHVTEIEKHTPPLESLFRIRMTNTDGDWWLFSFHAGNEEWTLINCLAKSDHDNIPHNLLGPSYSQFFRPFLNHVVTISSFQ